MRRDPPMREEIEQGFYPGFERSWFRVEVVGRLVLLVFVVACLLGVFGDGVLAHKHVQSADGRMQVEFEPMMRFAAPTHVKLTMRPEPGATEVLLRLSKGFEGAYGLQRISPAPVRESAWEDGEEMLLAVPQGQNTLTVRLDGLPANVGAVPLSISDGRGETATWKQIVVP